MSSKSQSPGLQGYSLNIFGSQELIKLPKSGRFSCKYPMAYKGNLRNKC